MLRFLVLLFVLVESQYSPSDNVLPQCECVPDSKGTGCLQYDSRFQASTLQEAMNSFPDLSLSQDGANPSPPIEEQSSCTTKECQDCNADLTNRLIEVGLLSHDPSAPLSSNQHSSCTKYSFSKNENTGKRNSGSEEDSHEHEEKNRGKRQTSPVVGLRYSLSCLPKGVTTDATGQVSLCSSCWVWRKLPDNYSPQYINELVCDTTDTKCLSDYASCSIGFRSIDVIQTVGNQRQAVSISAGNYCECKVSKGSTILPLVTGNASLNLVTRTTFAWPPSAERSNTTHMTAPYDPYNNVSYLDINRRKWGGYDREDGDRLENRAQQPLIKKLYLKRNGDEPSKKPKLFIWRQRQVPSLRHLLDDLGTFLGMQESVENLYDVHGHKISSESEIKDRAVYYVTGDEPIMFHEEYSRRAGMTQGYRNEARHSSMSAPELESFSRNSLYADLKANTPPPRPHSAQLPKRKQRKVKTLSKDREVDEFDRYYRAATRAAKSRADDYDYRGSGRYNSRVPELVESRARTSYDRQYREPARQEDHYRSRSVNGDIDSDQFRSDFHDEGWEERDKYALEKHKEKNSFRQRSNSGVIYHRRDQTNPEAYLIYVFLNGQGMESQHVSFQKKQLEKGMNYVLELVARRLCDMDGRRIHNVSDLMSRGAYVLVPVGQTFRDTWYFLPDNAIDTSSNRDRVNDRSAQRDRLLQRRERRNATKQKTKKTTSRSVERMMSEPFVGGYDNQRYQYD